MEEKPHLTTVAMVWTGLVVAVVVGGAFYLYKSLSSIGEKA